MAAAGGSRGILEDRVVVISGVGPALGTTLARRCAEEGADLVLEVVSPDKPERDLVEKRSDYAEAGVPEYWIANPQTEMITVLWLEDDAYVEHGSFGRGSTATSALLPGFEVAVDAVFDAD